MTKNVPLEDCSCPPIEKLYDSVPIEKIDESTKILKTVEQQCNKAFTELMDAIEEVVGEKELEKITQKARIFALHNRNYFYFSTHNDEFTKVCQTMTAQKLKKQTLKKEDEK